MSQYGNPEPCETEPRSLSEARNAVPVVAKAGVKVRTPPLCKIDGVEVKEGADVFRLFHQCTEFF